MELSKTTINTQAPISSNGSLFAALKQYLENRKAISELENMSDMQLMDIGVSRGGIKAAVTGDLYR